MGVRRCWGCGRSALYRSGEMVAQTVSGSRAVTVREMGCGCIIGLFIVYALNRDGKEAC